LIFVTGDIHGINGLHKLDGNKTLEGITKNDYLIILGDFGLVWGEDADLEQRWLEWLSRKEYTTLVIDGNHENFDRLYSYPVQDFMAGKASQLHDSVWWLQRGEVYEIDGCRCFTFGGASSVDKDYRVPGKSWWAQELPSEEEFQNGMANLEKNGWKVDYVFTHTCPTRIRRMLPQPPAKDSAQAERLYNGTDAANEMLEIISRQLTFRRWYFGHFHMDLDIMSPLGKDEKFTALYHQIMKIAAPCDYQQRES
jgi:hypothetical protein